MSLVRLALGLPCALLCVGCFGSSGEADDDAGASGGVGGGENSVPLLESLGCEALHNNYEVTSMRCYVDSESVGIVVRREIEEFERSDRLVSAEYGSLSLGVLETEYGGDMSTSRQVDTYVDLDVCGLGAHSVFTPSPCELELQEIKRGTLEITEVDGEPRAYEIGSFVRMRVSCPDGLISPGNNIDVGPTLRTLVPSEFLLEASDCGVPIPETEPE